MADAAPVLDSVKRIAREFANQRRQRQLRRELDPKDFAALRDAGFLLTGVPAEQGGLWVDLARSARQIAENAGEDGAVVAGKIIEKDDYAFGYNASTGEYGNLVKQGVIDPAKVVRTALQDAASIAGLLITTEAMVAERPKKQAAPAMPGGGGMGGMDF